MKAVFGAGQQGSAAVPIISGVAALGAGVYYLGRSKPGTTPEQDRRGRAEAKKAEGLSGAGIGGNAVTGGHELSHVNSNRKGGTTAPPEKLPSGGVGGGVGQTRNGRANRKCARSQHNELLCACVSV